MSAYPSLLLIDTDTQSKALLHSFTNKWEFKPGNLVIDRVAANGIKIISCIKAVIKVEAAFFYQM